MSSIKLYKDAHHAYKHEKNLDKARGLFLLVIEKNPHTEEAQYSSAIIKNIDYELKHPPNNKNLSKYNTRYFILTFLRYLAGFCVGSLVLVIYNITNESNRDIHWHLESALFLFTCSITIALSVAILKTANAELSYEKGGQIKMIFFAVVLFTPVYFIVFGVYSIFFEIEYFHISMLNK